MLTTMPGTIKQELVPEQDWSLGKNIFELIINEENLISE